MAFGFFRKFVTTAYVGIVMDSDRCDVHIKVYKGTKQIKTETHTLRMEDGQLSRVGLQFLNSLYKKYYFVYAGTLLLTINQGAINGFGRQCLEDHEIRQTGTKIIDVDKVWTFYSSEADLVLLQDRFKPIGGLDAIFSSFSVIDKLKEEGCHIYILKLNGFATVAVFDNDELMYGNFFMFVPKEVSFDEGLITEGDHESSHDSGMDDDDDPFAVMGDMDEATEMTESDTVQIASLEKDTKLIEFTKNCLNSYYKEPVYKAKFVDKVFVLDPYNESEAFKALAEEELLLPIEIKHISLCEAICSLTLEEVKAK